MKKIVVSLLVLAVALFVGCSQDDGRQVVDFNVPSEFHGNWESVDVVPAIGRKSVLVVSAGDLVEEGISMESSLNTLFGTTKESADELGVPFDVVFSQSHPYTGLWSFSYTMAIGTTSMVYTCTFELVDNQLRITSMTLAPNPDTGEMEKTTTSEMYNPL